MLERIFRNGPAKLSTLGLAILLWFFVTETSTTTSQRSFLVDLSVVGLEDNQVVTNVPRKVEVSLSGQSDVISLLNPEAIDAVLDLRNQPVEFEQRVRFFPPEGIRLESITPDTVIGFIDSRVSKSIPIKVAALGSQADDILINLQARPDNVTVTGQSQQVNQVVAAMAPFDLDENGLSQLYAVDEANQPITGVTLIPNEVFIDQSETPIFYSKRLPLGELSLLDLSPFTVTESLLNTDTLELVGSKASLEALESIPISLPETTIPTEAGRYTLNVVPTLPQGVSAREIVRVQLSLEAPSPLPPEPPEEINE